MTGLPVFTLAADTLLAHCKFALEVPLLGRRIPWLPTNRKKKHIDYVSLEINTLVSTTCFKLMLVT
jgi:hypothetical protein